MGDNENMTTRMGEVSGAAFGFIHISPHTFLSLSLFTRSLVLPLYVVSPFARTALTAGES